MKILEKHLYQVWFEDKEDNKWYPTKAFWQGKVAPPPGYCIQHSLGPTDIAHLVCHIWTKDLVSALVTIGGWELDQAIIIASTVCERCTNALTHQIQLSWGYSTRSKEYRTSKTRCKFCD